MVKTKCEVYSRSVGYIRPVENWSDSKQAEFGDRHTFDESINKYFKDKEIEPIVKDIQKQLRLEK